MSSSGSKGFKLTLKKTPSQQQPSNGLQPSGSGRAPLPQPTPSSAAAPGSVPRKVGLTLKGLGSARSSTPTGTPAAPRINLKGAGSGSHATPGAAAAATPQQAAVAPSPAPGSAPRRFLALKGSRQAAAGTPATPAPAAAAATPASAPRTAPPAVGGGGAGGFATPRPAAVASARAASTTPASAGGGSAQPVKKKLGIKLKGSSSTPGSLPRPAAAAPGSSPAAGGGSAPVKPRITLNRSRGRQSSMGLGHQQHSMHQAQHHHHGGGLQPAGAAHPPLQPVAYKHEQAAAAAAQQAGHYGADYYASSGHQQGYDASYGGMHGAGYGAYGSGAAGGAGMDPAAAAGGMYGAGTDYAAAAAAHGGADPSAAAGMYGAGGDHLYGMHGYDAAAAAATAVVDYSSYYQPQQQQKKGQKRGRASAAVRPAAAAAAPAEPLGPRAKRPKPGQFRDTEEEDADEDFNPKAERARMVRGGGGGGIATARVKSKGPTGARAAAAGWAQPRAVPAAARPGGNRAAAAQKAAHRAAQNAAQRMHPHMMSAPQRAGGGHMSAVVPTHRPRQHMVPAGGAAPAAPRSPVLGEDAPMPSGAELAAAFARSTAAQDAEAAVGLGLDHQGSDAMDAAAAPVVPVHAPAPRPGPKAGRGRGGAQPRKTVEQVLAELHAQVEYVEETHPPNRELLNKLLAAVDKRDKYRFFGKPVTDEQAPGYSNIIRNPMDLSVMKSKVEGGMYSSWNELMADIILMCANAKVYNHPNTKPHKEADVIFKYSMKYVKSFKQGKFALRGAVAMAVRNANAQEGGAAAAGSGGAGAGGDAKGAAAAPSGPMTRNARRGGRRPREEDEGAAKTTNKRARGQAKFIALSQNSAVDFMPSSMDGDSVRESFKGRRQMYAALWGGLADGASPEGVPFGGSGRPVLRCVAGHAASLPPDTYLNSLSRFVSGAGAAAEKLVLKMLGQDLASKLVPIPGVTPTQLMQQQGGHAAGPRPLAQQPQQLPGAGGAAVPGQAHALQQQQQQQQTLLQQAGPPQQQSLAGLFGGGLGGLQGFTPAQLAQLQHNQLQQLRQQQQQQGQIQQMGQQQQQFVPGPGLLARPPGAMPARQQ